jgi:metal-responsive CopG/Arc/MetJ family transcriptional regulator
MEKSIKVAISLPNSLLESVEAGRKLKGQSRSEYFRHAVEKFLKDERETKDVQAYIKGYTDIPETAEELELFDKLGAAALAEAPW